MQQYEKYKDSGVDWIGEIPEHWEIRKLKFLGNIYAGINGKKGDDFSKEYSEGIKSFIPFTNICNNIRIDETKYQFVKIDEKEKQNRVQKNDILFLMSSETLDDIAKNSIYLGNDDELYLNSFCKGFRISDSNVFPEFINYLFLSTSYRNYFSLVGRGFTRINLKQEFINDIYTLLPSLPEQQTIATFLDDKTAKIDQTIANKQKEIELLKERRQILIQKAVTKGLDETVPLKDSGVDWIGEIPEHWEVRKLKYVVYMQSGETITAESFTDEGYSVMGGNGFRGYTNRYTNEGDFILIGRQGALCGNVNYAQGKFFATEHAIVVYPNKDVLDILWLGEVIKLADLNKLSQTAAQPGISVTQIKNVIIPFIPQSEQLQIVEYLKKIEEKIAKAILLKQQEIEKLKEYKTVLIDNVVTGKVKI